MFIFAPLGLTTKLYLTPSRKEPISASRYHLVEFSTVKQKQNSKQSVCFGSCLQSMQRYMYYLGKLGMPVISIYFSWSRAVHVFVYQYLTIQTCMCVCVSFNTQKEEIKYFAWTTTMVCDCLISFYGVLRNSPPRWIPLYFSFKLSFPLQFYALWIRPEGFRWNY